MPKGKAKAALRIARSMADVAVGRTIETGGPKIDTNACSKIQGSSAKGSERLAGKGERIGRQVAVGVRNGVQA